MLIETVLGTGIRNPKWFVQVLTSIHHLYFARHVASFQPVASYPGQSQQQDQGDVLCAPLGGRGPPHQGLGPAQGVDGQVHGGVLQPGGQGEGDGAGCFSAV